jgi:hypothetical protein
MKYPIIIVAWFALAAAVVALARKDSPGLDAAGADLLEQVRAERALVASQRDEMALWCINPCLSG